MIERHFKRRPVNVRAVEWLKHGDHPEVLEGPIQFVQDSGQTSIVHQIPIAPENGWIKTLENAHEVTPGDFIIRGVKGELYPCKPDIFWKIYEEIEVVDAEFVS